MQPRGGQAQIGGNMPIPSDGTTFSHNIKGTHTLDHSVPEGVCCLSLFFLVTVLCCKHTARDLKDHSHTTRSRNNDTDTVDHENNTVDTQA
jgi:hypothetical protein